MNNSIRPGSDSTISAAANEPGTPSHSVSNSTGQHFPRLAAIVRSGEADGILRVVLARAVLPASKDRARLRERPDWSCRRWLATRGASVASKINPSASTCILGKVGWAAFIASLLRGASVGPREAADSRKLRQGMFDAGLFPNEKKSLAKVGFEYSTNEPYHVEQAPHQDSHRRRNRYRRERMANGSSPGRPNKKTLARRACMPTCPTHSPLGHSPADCRLHVVARSATLKVCQGSRSRRSLTGLRRLKDAVLSNFSFSWHCAGYSC